MSHQETNFNTERKYTLKQKIGYTAFTFMMIFFLVSISGEILVRSFSEESLGKPDHAPPPPPPI